MKASLRIGKEELLEALVDYAQRVTGVKYPLRHKIDVVCQMLTLEEDGAIFVVNLEHLENVVPLDEDARKRNG